MMLEAFTWQHFLVAALILSVVWYLGVGFLYYKTEISNFLSPGGNFQKSEPLLHSWQDEVDDMDADLVGKQVEEHGVSVIEADEFNFLPVLESTTKLDLLGEFADVQEEIKSICRILEKEDGTKEDFFSLFSLIKNKYPKISSSDLLPQLDEFILEHLPFHLEEEELERLWI